MEKQMDILVVDDEQIMRSLFIDLLSDQGHKVSTAIDGTKAVELVKQKFYHIAFIDMHMPVMNGVQTLKSIKEISPKTLIVMMDSFPDIFAQEALKEGAVTCIHKPFNIQEVIEIVENIIADDKGRV